MPTAKTRSAGARKPAIQAAKAPATPARKKPAARAAAPAPDKPARTPASLPKSDGDEGIRVYIDSMEPWQAAIAHRIDALAVQHLPNLRKAIRWKTPFYGVDGQGWAMAFNGYQRYIKLAFFRGAWFDPAPPITTKVQTRYVHYDEAGGLDEAQLVDWLKQAAAIPGWDGGSPRLYGGTPD